MTQKTKEKNAKVMQKQETKQPTRRKRKLIKIFEVQNKFWEDDKALFIEKVKIAGKRLYERDAFNDWNQLRGLYPKNRLEECINEEGKICTIMVNYGVLPKTERVQGMKGNLAPVCCKAEDFEKFNIGETISVYLVKWKSIDGTEISLYLYNFWN